MKKFVSFILKFTAVFTVISAAAYWLAFFLTASGKKEVCFEKVFPAKELPAPEEDN